MSLQLSRHCRVAPDSVPLTIRLAVVALLGLAGLALANKGLSQSLAPAVLTSPLEFGAGYSIGKSDFTNMQLHGPSAYVNKNIFDHFAAGGNFHRLESSDGRVIETTALADARAHAHAKFLTPFIQGVAGTGFLQEDLTGTWGTTETVVIGGGGGVDMNLPLNLAIHGEFEYQKWLSVVGFSGMTARVGTFGLTYRIRPMSGRY